MKKGAFDIGSEFPYYIIVIIVISILFIYADNTFAKVSVETKLNVEGIQEKVEIFSVLECLNQLETVETDYVQCNSDNVVIDFDESSKEGYDTYIYTLLINQKLKYVSVRVKA